MKTATATHPAPVEFKPRIRRLGPSRFLVESKSRPGTGHQVDTLHLQCSCEAGQHGMRCWHLVWALQAEQWYNRAAIAHKAHNAGRHDAPVMARPSGMAALQEAFA